MMNMATWAGQRKVRCCKPMESKSPLGFVSRDGGVPPTFVFEKLMSEC